MSTLRYKYTNNNGEIWYDNTNTITSSSDSTKYCLIQQDEPQLPDNTIFNTLYDIFMLDTNFDNFPFIYLNHKNNGEIIQGIFMNKMLYDYFIRNDSNFDIKSCVTSLISNNIATLKYTFWVNQIYKGIWTANKVIVSNASDKMTLYKFSILASHQVKTSTMTYLKLWPILFIYNETYLSTDINFLKTVFNLLDISDKAMFILIHAPIFYDSIIEGYTQWKSDYRSRADFAYDNYEDIIKVSNSLCTINFKVYMEHMIFQLLGFPTEYVETAVSDSLDVEYSKIIKANFMKITDWTAIRTVKTILLRTKDIEEVENIRNTVLNLFADEHTDITGWEKIYINYFAENAITMPFEDNLLTFQRELIFDIFNNSDASFRIFILYKYHCVIKGFLGIDTSLLEYTIETTEAKKEVLNKALDGLGDFDTNYIWRTSPIKSRDSDFDLFWSICAIKFNSNTEYVSIYVGKRTEIDVDPVNTDTNPNNKLLNSKLLKISWETYDIQITSIAMFQQIEDKLYQNNYQYTVKYINSFEDPFICALALVKFCKKINIDSSKSFLYTLWAIYDYIKYFGYSYYDKTFVKSEKNQYTLKYACSMDIHEKCVHGLVKYIENNGIKKYYKNGKEYYGDIDTTQVHAYIMSVIESNDEWKMLSGIQVSDFYNVFKYSPNVTNAKAYLQSAVIQFDNDRVDTASKIVNFTVSNNYIETKPLMIEGVSMSNILSVFPTLTLGTTIIIECRFKTNEMWGNVKYMLGVVAENGNSATNYIPKVRILYVSDDSEQWADMSKSVLRCMDMTNFDKTSLSYVNINKVVREGNYFKVTEKSTFKINNILVTVEEGSYMLFLFNNWKVVTNTNLSDSYEINWPLIIDSRFVIYNNVWTYKEYYNGYTKYREFIDMVTSVTNKKNTMTNERRIILDTNPTKFRGIRDSNIINTPDNLKKALNKASSIEDVINNLKNDNDSSLKTTTKNELNRSLPNTTTNTSTTFYTYADPADIDNINKLLDKLKSISKTKQQQQPIKLNKVKAPSSIEEHTPIGPVTITRNINTNIITLIKKYIDITIKNLGINKSDINNELYMDIVNNVRVYLYFQYCVLNNQYIIQSDEITRKYMKDSKGNNILPKVNGTTIDQELVDFYKNLMDAYPYIYVDFDNDFNITIYKDDTNEIQDYQVIQYDSLESLLAGINNIMYQLGTPIFSYTDILTIRQINNLKIFNNTLDSITSDIRLTFSNNDLLVNLPDLCKFETLFDVDEFEYFDITIPGSTKVVNGEYGFDKTCVLYKILMVDNLDVAKYIANTIQSGEANIEIPGTLSIEIPSTDKNVGCIKLACLRDGYYYSWFGFLQISQLTSQEVNYITKYDLAIAITVCISQNMTKIPYNTIFKSALDAGANSVIKLMIDSGFITNFISNAAAVFTPLDNTRMNSDGDKSGFPTFVSLSTSIMQLIEEMRKSEGERYVQHDLNNYIGSLGIYNAIGKKCYDYFLLHPESSYMDRKYEQPKYQ